MRSRWERVLTEARIQEFVHGEYPQVVAAVALVAGSHAAGEDAVQEAVTRAWERLNRGEAIGSMTGWVMRVSLNLAHSTLRRRRAEHRATERLNVIDLPASSDAFVDVEAALRHLTRREREVTVLHYYLEFSVRETAEALGVTEGTVKTLLFRARRSLGAALGDRELVQGVAGNADA